MEFAADCCRNVDLCVARVCKEIEVAIVFDLVDVAKIAARQAGNSPKLHIIGSKSVIEGSFQLGFKPCFNKVSSSARWIGVLCELPCLRLNRFPGRRVNAKHLPDDSAHLVVVPRGGRAGGELCGGDHLAAAVVKCLDLFEVAQADNLSARQDKHLVLLVVFCVVEVQRIPLHSAAFVDDVGMKVGEIPAGVERKGFSHPHVIGIRRLVFLAVKKETRLEVIDWVKHCDVSDMPAVLEQVPAAPKVL